MIKKILSLAIIVITLFACDRSAREVSDSTSKIMVSAEEALGRGDTAYAIDIYHQVITTLVDTSAYEAMSPIVIDAMDKLSNIKQKRDKREKEIQWLEELKKHPTSLIRTKCWRDLHTYLAMLYIQSGNVKMAEENMSAALDLPLIGENADKRYYRDYVQASRIFIGNDERRPEISGWLERALQHAQNCDNLTDLSYTRSMLSTLYFWEGRIGDAFAMMNDNLRDVEAKGDTVGMIMALNTLTNLHNAYHLYEIANTYISRAIALAEKANLTNSVTISDAYMLKIGTICDIIPDSVEYYVEKAEKNCQNRPYNMGQEDVDFAAANHIILSLQHDLYTDDSAKTKARDEAEMRLKRYVKNVAPIKRAGAYNLLSRLYMNENEVKAEAMLDSVYRYQHLVEGIPMATKEPTLLAITHYMKTGNTNKLIRYVKDLVDSKMWEKDNITEGQLVENIIELRTAQTQDKVKQLELEVELKQSRTILIVVISIAAFVLLSVLFIMYRRKQTLDRLKMQLEKLSLEKQLSTEVEKTTATKKELDDIVSDLNTRRTIEILTPDLLKQRGETEFQKRFHLLYPNFSKGLNDKGIVLSRREETMCMLVVLGHDNQDIASILNIERKSVNVARYRLRQKLKLNQDSNLDDFLKKCAQ